MFPAAAANQTNIIIMNRTTEHSFAGGLCAAVLCLGLHSMAEAATVYTFVDYPSMQNGYTLAGTITTDGTTGTYALNSEHVLGWEFSLTGGPLAYSMTSDDGTAEGDISVSSTTIVPVLELFSFCGFYQGGGTTRLIWYGQTEFPGMSPWDPPMVNPANLEIFKEGNPIAYPSISGSALETAGNVIATTVTVPEPSSAVLLSVMGCLGVLRRRRNP